MPNTRVLITTPLLRNEIDSFQENYPDFDMDYEPTLHGIAAQRAIVDKLYDAVIIGSNDPFTVTHFGDTLPEWRNAKGQDAKLAIITSGSQLAVNIEQIAQQNIALMTTPGANTKDVVQYILTKLPKNIAYKTIGLIGTGVIAKNLIVTLKKLGCNNIKAWSPNFTQEKAKELGGIYCKTAKDVCRNTDILIIQTHYFHMEHTAAPSFTFRSENLISKDEIDALNYGSTLISVSAHELINKEAFCEAVTNGKIERFSFNTTRQGIIALQGALPAEVQSKGQLDFSTLFYSTDTKTNLAKVTFERLQVYFQQEIAIDPLFNSIKFSGGANIALPPKQSPMRVKSITFIGTGKVVAFMAASLARANRLPGIQFQICILGRNGSELDAIKKNGITCKIPTRISDVPFDEYHIEAGTSRSSVFVTDNPKEIVEKFGKQSYIFVATKTYNHTEELVKAQINPLRDNDSYILLLQSGIPSSFLYGVKGFETEHLQSIDRDGRFLHALNPNKTIACTLDLACRYETDSKGIRTIVSANILNDIKIGLCTPNGVYIPEIFYLEQMVLGPHLGLQAHRIIYQIKLDFLKRLQIDLVLNSLTTLFGCKVGELLTEERLPLVRMLAYEVEIFAKSTFMDVHGLHTREELEEKIKNSNDHITSMLDDFINGKKLEIDSLCLVIPELHQIVTKKSGDAPLNFYCINEITHCLNAINQKPAIMNEIKTRLEALMAWAKEEERIMKPVEVSPKSSWFLANRQTKEQSISWSSNPDALIPTLPPSLMPLHFNKHYALPPSIYPGYNKQPRPPILCKPRL